MNDAKGESPSGRKRDNPARVRRTKGSCTKHACREDRDGDNDRKTTWVPDSKSPGRSHLDAAQIYQRYGRSVSPDLRSLLRVPSTSEVGHFFPLGGKRVLEVAAGGHVRDVHGRGDLVQQLALVK